MEDLRNILLSDANIYKAILSVDSYIYNPELMDYEDKKLLSELKDKFNYNLLFELNFIDVIRQIIIKIIDNETSFFNCSIYFKVKKPKEGVFRPLHIAPLRDCIAMVAMLQVLIFDMSQSNQTKMKLSNLSKYIPSNFYGNIPSKNPELLFESWQNQYKKYTEKANQKFSEYENNEKYNYEVTLDLENFFPSINPSLVYNLIVKSLKVKYSSNDMELIRKVVCKLLLFTVESYNSKENSFYKQLYYSDCDKNKNFKEFKLKINNKLYYFTKGIPQGLPQSYFFGNLIMKEISDQYDIIFKGDSLFYVDDSIIFTSIDLSKTGSFESKINTINIALDKYSNNITVDYLPYDSYIKTLFNDLSSHNYKIKIHDGGKSTCVNVKETKIGYKYLKYLSRLASMASFDFKTTFSDLEEIQLKGKFETLIKALDKELKLCYFNIQEQKGCNGIFMDKNCYYCSDKSNCFPYENYKEYCEKLKRFKRFFQFRILMIQMKESDQVIKDLNNEFNNLDINEIEDKLDNELLEIKLTVLENYLLEHHNVDDDFRKIVKNIIDFEVNTAKGRLPKNTSFFYYNRIFSIDNKKYHYKTNPYKSIIEIVSQKINSYNKHISYQKDCLKELLYAIQRNRLVEYVFSSFSINEIESTSRSLYETKTYSLLEKSNRYNTFCYWSVRSKFLRRYLLNTAISLILNIELNENLYISRRDKKPLNYYELRLATASRNIKMDINLICHIMEDYSKTMQQARSLDYTVFEAIYYFRLFAREPKYIDNLILIHKYTTELWENGSKHMHFYTLHNQSHAVELIKNINIILKSIDFLKISKIDYYILYISCYLHDISMVLYPKHDKFLGRNNNDSNELVMWFAKEHAETNPLLHHSLKELLLNVYKKIDEVFENTVRSNHAKDSANFIKRSNDLDFIDKAILEIVADVSYSHGMDTRDVYHLKSNATSTLISKKFMMILIRLADLFDMSESRVSLPVFYNNKDNMSPITQFHWISHLITGSFKIINQYAINETDIFNTKKSYFSPRSITETIVIQININLDQLTTIKNSKKCSMVCMEPYDQSNKLILNFKQPCDQDECNFICKWFTNKNYYLIYELYFLQQYLDDVNNYFKTEFIIELLLSDNNILRLEDFDDLSKYITNN
ncbi:MAG: hypothetical protein K0R00_2779 [Herbinix sp.]|jgi:hypothetical protein|nr:hypothetical protein [Herbinix sp.]